ELLPRGIAFFARYGWIRFVIGRFVGAIRAIVALAGGGMHMPRGRFFVANVTSALVWAPMLLFVGDVSGDAGERLIGSGNTVVLVFAGLTLFGLAGILWAALRGARPKA